MTDNDSSEEEADDTEDDLRENFIKEMMRAGYDRNKALKALGDVQPDQIDEGKFNLHFSITFYGFFKPQEPLT